MKTKPALGPPNAFQSNLEAAQCWHGFGLRITPMLSDGSGANDPYSVWRDRPIIPKNIDDYWARRLGEEVGCYLGPEFVVLEASNLASAAALKQLEGASGAKPDLVVLTAKGEAHFFRRSAGLVVEDMAAAEGHRSPIKVLTGDEVLFLPPARGRSVKLINVDKAHDLAEACQAFIDAVHRHNRRPRKNRLDRHSLAGTAEEMQHRAVAQVAVLGPLALMGQATVFYAAPNVGKTLIALYLLCQAIAEGRVDPSSVYYINVDDSSQGLAQKTRIADEYGFHTLAEGFKEFTAAQFAATLSAMVDEGQAHGVVVILDTLKKFVELMDKTLASRFAKVVRRFVMSGGTVIALAHTNKSMREGKPVYGGTSDIVDDFDCAYTIAPLPATEPGQKIVVFENFKRRGDVARQAAYTYATEDGISYEELLASVRPIDPDQFEVIQRAVETVSDAEMIRAIETCIREGCNTKMLLSETSAKRVGVSKRTALRVIERYTGDDSSQHRWSYSVQARGAKVFVLLDAGPPDSPSTA